MVTHSIFVLYYLSTGVTWRFVAPLRSRKPYCLKHLYCGVSAAACFLGTFDLIGSCHRFLTSQYLGGADWRRRRVGLCALSALADNATKAFKVIPQQV